MRVLLVEPYHEEQHRIPLGEHTATSDVYRSKYLEAAIREALKRAELSDADVISVVPVPSVTLNASIKSVWLFCREPV